MIASIFMVTMSSCTTTQLAYSVGIPKVKEGIEQNGVYYSRNNIFSVNMPYTYESNSREYRHLSVNELHNSYVTKVLFESMFTDLCTMMVEVYERNEYLQGDQCDLKEIAYEMFDQMNQRLKANTTVQSIEPCTVNNYPAYVCESYIPGSRKYKIYVTENDKYIACIIFSSLINWRHTADNKEQEFVQSFRFLQ